MRITEGITLIKPNIQLPWGIDTANCVALLSEHGLTKKSGDLYEVRCQWLSTEPEVLQLIFNKNGLRSVELHRTSSAQASKSFKRWQTLAENLLGQPTSRELEYFTGPQSSFWQAKGIRAYHRYYYRSGFVEKLGVEKT